MLTFVYRLVSLPNIDSSLIQHVINLNLIEELRKDVISKDIYFIFIKVHGQKTDQYLGKVPNIRRQIQIYILET